MDNIKMSSSVKLSEKACFAVEFLDLEMAANVADAQWEIFQLGFLNNSTRFGIDVKARQIAWSFTAALDAVVDGILNPKTPHVFVSINLEEAKEKIRYAKAIIEALDQPVRPVLTSESQTALEFTNGSRLISHPCRPPRGKARTRLYLDEMAHYKEGLDRQIYTAALPATTKGDGYIRIGSSPIGGSGLFWEIATETLREWPGFENRRRFIPWWTVEALCQDVKTARLVVPQMLTEERVYQLGTPALVEIFENMFLEDFQQEYECAWVDESVAWITWNVIKANQAVFDGHWWHAKSVAEAIAAIPQIKQAVWDGRIESVLCGGLDVGRKHDLTELVLLGKGWGDRLPIRFSVSLDRVKYDDQEDCFKQILTELPITQVLIDRNGIGNQLAENLERTGKAQGIDYTNASKELWAVEARIQAGRTNTPLPPDREIAYQIHSIKKTITAAKNNRFDTERNEKHHADKFWAWATGIWAAQDTGGGQLQPGPNPMSGYRG